MIEDGSTPDDRCGYVYNASTIHDVGDSSCWRPTWNDEDRCIWHADGGPKSREALAKLAPDEPERLDGAVLDAVDLDGIDWFEGCSLIGAEFTAVDLYEASLVGADLREATLENVDARKSDLRWVNLEDASIRSCDLRFADLRHARLDQTVLANTRIGPGTTFGDEVVYEEELEDVDADADERYQSRAQAAIWAYREIHDIHEKNALPYEARRYYLKEKDVRRRLAWRMTHWQRALMAEGSRWITGYGMSPWRVLGTAAVIIVVSALLYPTTGGLAETVTRGGDSETITWTIEDPESTSRYVFALVFFRSLYFSIVTFATLGYGDLRPIGDIARALAGVEALLGQMLVALLVFVLSRRIS